MVKNSAANVFRGGSASIVAVLLPPFLTRYMSPEAYGVWALVLQVAAYVNFLDFGIQTAVGRFVAHDNERQDIKHRSRMVSTSFFVLCFAALLGMLATTAIALCMPTIFPKLPLVLVHEASRALTIIALSFAIGLPASVFNAIFVGLHRNEVPAIITAFRNFFGAAILVWLARSGGTIVKMAWATAAIAMLSYALQYLAYREATEGGWIALSLVSRLFLAKIVDYCKSLSVWSFAMLLVTGIDLMLVGIFDPRALPYYAVAATLVSFLAGLQNAIFSAMVPYTAAMHAKGERTALGATVVASTRYGMFILLGSGLPLLFAPTQLLSAWVGANYALHAHLLLRILVTANIVRLSATPYVVGLIGAGEQRLVIISPFFEAGSNLLVSLIAGYYFGAVGIAGGTFVGAVVGLALHIFYNMPRTTGLHMTSAEFAKDGLLRPVLCVLPLLLAYLLAPFIKGFELTGLFTISVLATLGFVWRWGLLPKQLPAFRPEAMRPMSTQEP